MAVKLELAAAERVRLGDVRADIRAALALRHRHPAERAELRLDRTQLRVVDERRQLRQPRLGKLGLGAQRRRRGEGHRERAADAGLDLGQQHEHRGACGMRAAVAPGESVQPVADTELEQRMPGRVELDLVDPLAEAIVCP